MVYCKLLKVHKVGVTVHCRLSSTSQLRVRVGEHSFFVDEGSESNAVIANIIVHPSYIESQNKNDIALIKLTKPVDITSKYTRTACLPVMSDMTAFYQTSECYTTGWGKTHGRILNYVSESIYKGYFGGHIELVYLFRH